MPLNHQPVTKSERDAIFAAFDSLPAILRHEIAFAARVWDAADMLPIYLGAAQKLGASDAVEWLRASIHVGDERAILADAARYQALFGVPLPHVAAEASVLRYSEPRRPTLRRVVRNPAARRALAGLGRLMEG